MQLPWPVINLQSVDSTNNYAQNLLSKNELNKEVVINAHCQEQGRGQGENTWVSEAGKNLTFTLVIFPDYLPAEKQFYLLQSISSAIVDFLALYKINAKIKWPNDIYVSDSKIAGILIENSIMGASLVYSLIGIGLNVNQEKFGSFTHKAQSMKNLIFTEYKLEKLLNRLLLCLKERIDSLKEKQFVKIKKEYIERLYKFNERSLFFANGNRFYGKITDVEEGGNLIIMTDNGDMLSFVFKELEFVS